MGRNPFTKASAAYHILQTVEKPMHYLLFPLQTTSLIIKKCSLLPSIVGLTNQLEAEEDFWLHPKHGELMMKKQGEAKVRHGIRNTGAYSQHI